MKPKLKANLSKRHEIYKELFKSGDLKKFQEDMTEYSSFEASVMESVYDFKSKQLKLRNFIPYNFYIE